MTRKSNADAPDFSLIREVARTAAACSGRDLREHHVDLTSPQLAAHRMGCPFSASSTTGAPLRFNALRSPRMRRWSPTRKVGGAAVACKDPNGWKLKDASTIALADTACANLSEGPCRYVVKDRMDRAGARWS